MNAGTSASWSSLRAAPSLLMARLPWPISMSSTVGDVLLAAGRAYLRFSKAADPLRPRTPDPASERTHRGKRARA